MQLLDYIVVGSGSSGSVLATRLGFNLCKSSVLLIEVEEGLKNMV